MNYLCHRCGYESNFKSNMKSHLDKLIKCTKNINSIGKSDSELYKLSLQPNKNKLNNTFLLKIFFNKNYIYGIFAKRIF